MTDVPEVLFVCVHNAGRSQMAAALLDHHAQGKVVVVRSAGSDPADRLNPAVVAAMAGMGIDLSREFPKPLTDASVRAADVVITMGCGTPARSPRASGTRTGSSRTPPASPSRPSVASATTSTAASNSSSPSFDRGPGESGSVRP